MVVVSFLSSPTKTWCLLYRVKVRANLERIEATVVRTAGGRIHPALSTLYVLAAVGNEGKKGLIIVVHHTDCGLCHTSDEDIKESLRRRLAGEGEEIEAVERMRFGSIVE